MGINFRQGNIKCKNFLFRHKPVVPYFHLYTLAYSPPVYEVRHYVGKTNDNYEPIPTTMKFVSSHGSFGSNGMKDLQVSRFGDKMYILNEIDKIEYYHLNNDYDLFSAELINETQIPITGGNVSSIKSFQVSDDGKYLFTAGFDTASNFKIFRHILNIRHDTGTVYFRDYQETTTIPEIYNGSVFKEFYMTPDGLDMYVVYHDSTNGTYINHYFMDTEFDLTTLNFDESDPSGSDEKGFQISDDGLWIVTAYTNIIKFENLDISYSLTGGKTLIGTFTDNNITNTSNYFKKLWYSQGISLDSISIL